MEQVHLKKEAFSFPHRGNHPLAGYVRKCRVGDIVARVGESEPDSLDHHVEVLR